MLAIRLTAAFYCFGKDLMKMIITRDIVLLVSTTNTINVFGDPNHGTYLNITYIFF